MRLDEATEILKNNGYLLKEDAFRNNTDMASIYAIIEAHGWSPELVAEEIIKHYHESPKNEKFLDEFKVRLERMYDYINDCVPEEKIKFESERFTNGIKLTIFKKDKIDSVFTFTIKDDKIVIKEDGEILDADYNISNNKLYDDIMDVLYNRYI